MDTPFSILKSGLFYHSKQRYNFQLPLRLKSVDRHELKDLLEIRIIVHGFLQSLVSFVE